MQTLFLRRHRFLSKWYTALTAAEMLSMVNCYKVVSQSFIRITNPALCRKIQGIPKWITSQVHLGMGNWFYSLRCLLDNFT